MTPGAGLSAARANYLRAAPHANAKEWFHFIVLGDNAELIANFSCVQSDRGKTVARVMFLIRRGEIWQGGETELIDAALVPGKNEISSTLGSFHTRGDTTELSISALGWHIRLFFHHSAQSAFATTTSADGGAVLNWIGLPGSRVTGYLRSANLHISFQNAPGYTDHNWGEFSWGGDFSWDWCMFLPREGDSLSGVYTCLRDASGQVVLSEALMLWSEGRYLRTFRDSDLSMRARCRGRQSGVLRIPAVMNLAVAGKRADLVAIDVTGSAGSDWIHATFEPIGLAQIAAPDDGPAPGAILLGETSSTASINAVINGQQFEQVSPSIVERARRVSP